MTKENKPTQKSDKQQCSDDFQWLKENIKVKLTNKMVAEALGWKIVKGEKYDVWVAPNGSSFALRYLPDFTNDQNASTKYVWPKIVNKLDPRKVKGIEKLKEIAFEAMMSDNSALCIATEFMKLRGLSHAT